MQSEKQYIDLYTEAQQLIKEHAAPVLNEVRDKAFEDFRRQGFPTKKVERYKYTDMQKLFEPDYGLNLNRLEIPVNPYETFKCDVPNLSTSLYFIVNDQFYSKALPKAKLNDGVIVDSLNHVATERPELVAKYYGRLANTEADAITALNTMLAQDGLFIYVPKNVQLERTIQVINILRSDVDLMVNRRVLIVLEEGAKAQFLFCDHAADDRNFLATQVIEAYVGANANLELNCLEETHAKNVRVSNVYIEQQRDSRASHNVITLHNGVTRNMLDLVFKGEGSECFCNGCVIADKSQHVDNNTLIDHQVPHCTSNELTSTYLMIMQLVLSLVVCLFAKVRRRRFHRRTTVIFVPARQLVCSPSQCLRFMLMMFSVIMAQQLDSSMMLRSSTCSSVVLIRKKQSSFLSLPLSMR